MDPRASYEEFYSKLSRAYASKRPKSEKMFREAQSYLPGGDTRTVAFYRPFPSFIDHGKGCRVYDVDGNEYIDFGNNQTSLIHGHAHPKVVEAVIAQVRLGSAFAAPVELQYRLGRILCDRVPSLDKVRFCNSGTEATMGTIRLARAYRRRYKIVKVEGGYHGSHDLVEISVKPPIDKAGPPDYPVPVPEDPSVPPNVVRDCIVIPFNDPSAAVRIIEERKEEIAGVILEPVQGSCGMVPADTEYIRAIRDVTLRYDIPLIFDEVYTLRLSYGGWQGMHNIVPDLTALGKIIGGGYPVGAVGGREKFMEMFSPLRPDFLVHSGTFNGNPITMAAGVAAMELLTPTEIERINRLGERLRAGLVGALKRTGIIAQVTGIGSLSQIHFAKNEVVDWRSASRARVDLRTFMHLLLLDRGIFPAARLMFNISTPMGEAEVDRLGKAFEDSLTELKPYIEKAAPELLAG